MTGLPEMTKDLPKSTTAISARQFTLWALAIVAVGLLLRLWNLDFSYSNDELSALSRVRFDSFTQLVRDGFYVDGHPGGIQVFLYYWVKLFGMSEWAVRLPFALLGGLGVWFTIKTFARWFGHLAGLLSGAFVAFLIFPLVYSQIARPYGAGLAFTMMMVWFWTRLLFDEKPKSGIAVAYAMSAAACMYNHYFSFLLALIVGITGLFYLRKDRILYYLGAGLAAALLFSPHIYITLNHLSIGGVGLWLAKPTVLWPVSHLFYVFNESWIVLGLVSALLVLQIFTFKKTPGLFKFRLFSLLFFILPLLVGFFYSRMVNPVLQHSVLIFSFPFLLGFLFSFSGNISRKWWLPLLVGTMLIGVTDTVILKSYYRQQHFGEFKGVAQAIGDWNTQYGADKITTAVSANNPWYIQFYLDQLQSGQITFVQTDNRGGEDLDSLKLILDDCKTPFFLYAWTKPVPFEIRDMILSRFPYIVDEVDFQGFSEATLYSRQIDNFTNKVSDTLFFMEFPPADSNSTETTAGPEFFPGFEGRLVDLLPYPDGKDELVVVTSVKISDSLSGAVLVASINDEDGETLFWSGAKFDLFTRKNSESTVRLTLNISEKKLFHKRLKLYVWNPKKVPIHPKYLVLVKE